jgi:hypothetical protein
VEDSGLSLRSKASGLTSPLNSEQSGEIVSHSIMQPLENVPPSEKGLATALSAFGKEV